MTSKEALKELYNERSYAYGDKVCNKGKEWNEAIKHYDNIGKCLQIIDRDLEVLANLILKDQSIVRREEDTQSSKRDSNAYDIKEPKETKKGME